MPTCYVVGAGEFTARGFAPASDDFVIAADAGYLHLRAIGMEPGLLVGDFDSLGDDLPAEHENGPVIMRCPARKDETDSGIALAEGWKRGFRTFAIYGGGGGRLDHLVANVQNMCHYCRQGGQVRLVDPAYELFVIHNGTLTLPLRPRGTLASVFCHGNAAYGVTLQGLSYSLTGATLTCDFPVGISNQVLYDNQPAQVSVEDGMLIVMLYNARDELFI